MTKNDIGLSETPDPDTEKKEVESWLRTIAKTEKDRDEVGNKAGWKRFIDEYKNEWGFLQKNVSIPIIPINLIYAYTKTEIARLYFRDPWITVNAKRVEDFGAAQIAEQIINYTWGDLALKAEIKKALLESILVGHSYVKVGYAAEFGTVESQPKEKRGPGRPPAKKVAEVETSSYIKSENVFGYHVPYKDVLFDPAATFPATHNARWMAHKITKPLRAIRESGIYSHTDDLKTSSASDDAKGGYDTAGSDTIAMRKEVNSATLYEIYDLDNMRVVTVSPGCPYYLNEIPYPDYLAGGFPFSMLAFNPVPGEVWPLSDVAAQEGLSIEMTKIVAIWINHLKRHNRQILIEPDLFTEAELDKFKDGNDGAIIKANGPIQNKYFIPQYPSVQADSYQIYNEAYKLYQVVSGQTPTDQGGPSHAPTRTLGELRLQMQGGHARAEEKVDVLEEFIEEIAKKMLTIMQKRYDLPKISRIVGPKAIQQKTQDILTQRPTNQPQLPGGQPNPLAGQSMTTDFSFSWNRQDILGEMDVDVVAGSTVPMDKGNQLQILEKLVPLLPAAGITPGSPAAKEYARQMFRLIGITWMESILDLVDQQPPQVSPEQQQMQADMVSKQADMQIKQQESQMKLQAQAAQEKIKLQALQQKAAFEAQMSEQKLAIEKQKAKIDAHKNIINTILQGVRSTSAPQENGNGLKN